ncbi:CBS domain-containing protein [Actinomadura latina]|uniref:CBS domain-containing protein n=1 Tax=Actinomadura latina TaxID=163603 RepID=A0A846YZ83_9ACTN|nr:CBS domain-containing protein [Actinomadura latina]NKZ03788.1 CBS domain-containing protein [Actinomadura latina]
MRARELAVDYPTVTPADSALDAARLLADRGLPGLVVVDGRRRAVAVIPGSRLLRQIVPPHVRDDPTLARVYDEPHADRLAARLGDRTVAELLEGEQKPLRVVGPDATAMEIASVMAGARSPVVAVSDNEEHPEKGAVIGVITAADLLSRLLPAPGDA